MNVSTTTVTPSFGACGDYYEALLDDAALVYTNSEVHQHPWFATFASLAFLVCVIVVIIECGGSDADPRAR